MPSSVNVHLCTERGVTLSSKVRAHPTNTQSWYTVTLTVATESDLSEHETAYFISPAQLATFADGLEDLALKVRALADEAAIKAEQRPLSPFAQQLVRIASEGIGSGITDADVEQRR